MYILISLGYEVLTVFFDIGSSSFLQLLSDMPLNFSTLGGIYQLPTKKKNS